MIGRRSDCLAGIDVAVLAGGLGTRIRPVLGDIPKLLAPVAGRPFADHMFAWLGRFGARRVVLCLGHRAERVVGHLAAAPPPFDVAVSIEPEPLGTAGALRLARPKLATDPVLVLNGDTWADADLAPFARAHRGGGAEATLLCTEVADTGRFGRVEIGDDRTVRAFIEKGTGSAGPGAISAGVYLLSARLLDRIAAGNARSLEREVFAGMTGARLRAHVGRFAFIDIGVPDDLDRAGEIVAGSRTQA
jgi:mannose-1-phosphate guanylyltransferase